VTLYIIQILGFRTCVWVFFFVSNISIFFNSNGISMLGEIPSHLISHLKFGWRGTIAHLKYWIWNPVQACYGNVLKLYNVNKVIVLLELVGFWKQYEAKTKAQKNMKAKIAEY